MTTSTLERLKITPAKIPFKAGLVSVDSTPEHQGVRGCVLVYSCVGLVCLERGSTSHRHPLCLRTEGIPRRLCLPGSGSTTLWYQRASIPNVAQEPLKKPHSVKTKHSRVSLSDAGLSSPALERAVTDSFQINKAN